MAYLGKLGALFEVECGSSQDHGFSENTTFETTAEGKTKAQVMLRQSRQWQIGYGLITPGQSGDLLALHAGEYGIGPFVWVHDDALVNNLLTPAASTCDPSAIVDATVSAGGPMAGAGRSFINASPEQHMFFGDEQTPVIPGFPVAGSASVIGAGASITVWFYRADGSYISGATGPPAGVAGSAKRISVRTVAPEGAAYCRISTEGASQATRSAITWTNELMDWTVGDGCPKAVVTGLSRSILMSLNNNKPDYGRYWSASFTIREVG